MEIIHVWMLPCPFRIFSSPVRQTAPGLDEQFRALLNSASWWISTSSGDSGLEIIMAPLKKGETPSQNGLLMAHWVWWMVASWVASLVHVQASRGLEDMIEPWNGDISLVDSLVLLPEKNGLVKTHPFHSLGKNAEWGAHVGCRNLARPKPQRSTRWWPPLVK